MSQQKIDAYKKEKSERKERLAKKKKRSKIIKISSIVVAIAIVGAIAGSIIYNKVNTNAASEAAATEVSEVVEDTTAAE
jgi:flagellar basal body-associated protein FliL